MLYRDAAKLHNLLNTSVSEVTKWANANKLPLDIDKMKMLIVTDEKHLSSKMGGNVLFILVIINSMDSHYYVPNAQS